MDFLGRKDLLEGIDIAELGVRVLGGVQMVDASYFSKVGGCSPVSGAGRTIVSCSLQSIVIAEEEVP